MTARTRTRRTESTRKETIGLRELDTECNKLSSSDFTSDNQLIIDLVRTGAAINGEAEYWAGQKETKTCILCNEADDDSSHFWHCSALQEARTSR